MEWELGVDAISVEYEKPEDRRSIIKRALLLLLAMAVLLLVAIAWVTDYHPFISYRNQKFQEAVISVQSSEVAWNELVPFEWDEVYLFHAYMYKKQMEEILGFSSMCLPYEVGEGTSQLIFLKGDKIVSTAYASEYMPDGVSYVIVFPRKEQFYEHLSYDDQAVFTVEKTGDQITLKFRENTESSDR